MNNNIRKIRLEEGITFTKLSELTGLSIGYLCHLEKETRNNPSYNAMFSISKALNKGINEIFFI